MKARYAALLLFALVACREDPGTYDYSEHVEIVERNTVEFLDGPTPYVKGVPRLFLGQFFYEPAGSERIFPLNGRDINVFVFDTAGDGTGQFTLEPIPIESGDRIQGKKSTRVIHSGLTFWGFGVFWDTPHDISQYSTFNISLKSDVADEDDVRRHDDLVPVGSSLAVVDRGGAGQRHGLRLRERRRLAHADDPDLGPRGAGLGPDVRSSADDSGRSRG